MNARVVRDVRAALAKVMHLSGAALAPEVAALLEALPEPERVKLRLLAVLIVKGTQ